jgi:hypothetical protein
MAADITRLTADSGSTDVALNPYVNASYVSLLREKRLNPIYAESTDRAWRGGRHGAVAGRRIAGYRAGCFIGGAETSGSADADSISWLHRQAWLRPSEILAPWWQAAIRRYGR